MYLSAVEICYNFILNNIGFWFNQQSVNITLNDTSIDKNFYMFILKSLKLKVLIDSLTATKK